MCCDGRKILTTRFCKSYNCPNKSTFKRISTQNNVMKSVFEEQNQKKTAKENRNQYPKILQVQKLKNNSASIKQQQHMQ